MVAKSVIEIDVLDAKFKTFAAEFEKLQKAVKGMTVEWQKIGTASTKATQTNNKELDKTVKAQKQISAELEKVDKSQKSLNKSIRDGNRELATTAKTAASIAGSLASAALSVAKWTAYGALGGGFGFGGLASSASDYRRQAQGYGTTTGQLRAANTNFGKYISPENALSNIADIKNDLSKQWILTGMGLGENQNPAQALPNAIRNAVSIFKQGGQSQQYAEARGLTEVFSLEELRRLSSLSEKELSDTIEAYKRDQEKMGVSDSDSKAWQDFWIQIKRSGQLIESVLINKLVALSPLLENMTKNLTDVLVKFIDSLGAYLASDRFPQDVQKFSDALVALFEIVKKVARFMGVLPESANKPTTAEVEETKKHLPWWARGGAEGVAKTAGERQDYLLQQFLNRGYSKEAAVGFIGGLKGENYTFDPWVKNPKSSATGLAQWLTPRQKDFEKLSGDSFKGSSFEDQVDFMFWELDNTEKARGEALKKAISREQGAQINMHYERAFSPGTPEYAKELDRRIGYARSLVIVEDRTGGNVHITTPALNGAGSAQ